MAGARFRDLAIGQPFDFVDDINPSRNSFFHHCVKTGPRTYRTEKETGLGIMRIGSINAKVFHIGPRP